MVSNLNLSDIVEKLHLNYILITTFDSLLKTSFHVFTMRTEKYILNQLKKRKLHFPLIDPDPAKNSTEKIARIAKILEEFGSDAVLVGGSTGVNEKVLDNSVTVIKKHFSKPVILFPGSAQGISKKADAIFFMSLLNSKDPLWI